MKLGKKAMTICAFAMGTVIFATSAMADVIIGSGYYRLKESVKGTAARLIESSDSATLQGTFSFKVDGVLVCEENQTSKIDFRTNSNEQFTKSYDKYSGESESMNYADPTTTIYKNSAENIYFVNTRTDENIEKMKNPFDEDIAKDMEKVLDAFVGSLKDIVQVEESDGKVMYTANLTESQIPAVANAITSFVIKYSFLDTHTMERYSIPALKEDLHVTNAAAKAVSGSDGLIESLIANAQLIGNDENGVSRVVDFELNANIYDVNSTVVAKPDMTNEKVEYQQSEICFGENRLGKYKSNVVTSSDGVIQKKGEKILEIKSIDDTHCTGSYYEVYKEGMAPENITSFDFTGTLEDTKHCVKFEYTDSNGEIQKCEIYSQGLSDIYINFGAYKESGVFIREFD